ncbi:MAG: hypothetical protein EBR28_00500 [Planctomycetia bacterium]|nr:hypothetical protein [Planctomycetia bacterium]
MTGEPLTITTRRLDAQRLLVADIVRLSRRIPVFPVERLMRLGVVDEARRRCGVRIGWAAIFLKAYALVARDRPALRSWIVPALLPLVGRPRWATSPVSVASLALSRPRGEETPAADRNLDPDAIWWARIREPDAFALPDLQALVSRHMVEPVEEVFRRQLELRMVPRLLRRIVLRWNLRSASAKRALRIGTFSLSTLAGEGCSNRGHPTFLTSSLSYDPLDDAGRMRVTLLADHRLIDGVPAARALMALEEMLTGAITRELITLAANSAASPPVSRTPATGP